MVRTIVATVLLAFGVASAQPASSTPDSVTLFDFDAGVGDWAITQLHDVKEEQPPVEIALDESKAMKLTFGGGRWPCVATKVIGAGGNFGAFRGIAAELTVDRPTIALFRVYQTKQDEEGQTAHWERTIFLRPGHNKVGLNIRVGPGFAVMHPKNGEVTQFVIGAHHPAAGQTLIVDNVRLIASGPEAEAINALAAATHDGSSAWLAEDYERAKKLPTFKVAGTDMEVKDVRELGSKVANQWKRPPENTLEQVEADFRAKFDELKKTHPRAVMAMLRDGEKGCDPADPEKVYQGWRDTYINSHSPDGPHDLREKTSGKSDNIEVFMRHRSALLRIDLSVVPKDATILAAELVIPRWLAPDLKAPKKAHVWVAEPCAREWDEYTVNGYMASKDSPWKAVNGTYHGAEPDFHPIFIAHGFGNTVNVFDFAEAVRFWQTHDNHGFMLHGDSNDYMRMNTREVKEVKKRPAFFVVWEPKS